MPPDSPTPEEEARLRRLLADARAREPMPDEVAERLDATLADLGRERADEAGPTVVPMARRRRRAMVGLLAAAAVVVVAGVGVTEVVRQSSGDLAQGSGSVAGSEEAGVSDRSDRDTAERGGDQDLLNDSEAEANAPAEAPTDRLDLPVEVRESGTALTRVGQQRLERDALRVRRDLPGRASRGGSNAVLYAPEGFTCEPESWGAGVFAAVRYGGQNAVLAFREPSDQNQVVEVLQCGTGVVLRSVTVTAP